MDRRLPRNVFHGAALDILYTTDEVEKIDPGARDRLLGFVEDFLDCGCDDAPFCGHPERKFVVYLLELREEGRGPEGIVDAMEAEYGLYAYTGDVLDFLDSSVRYLEAVEEVADTLAEKDVRDGARETREELVS